MSSKKFKLIEISDIHLGHPTTPTWLIIKNLELAIPDTPEMDEVDMIVLAGDVFDRLLTVPTEDIYRIRIWANKLLRLCKRRDIVLRVLEGTPSHDWKQSSIFTEINETAEIHADCKYIQKLSIDFVERFGFSFLYVPDEWRPSPDQTWREVQGLLKQEGLEKVDFSIMHGFFPHQLPDHLVPGAHDPERYLSITDKAVFIGHVHKFSNYERIWAGGSFDRIAHNEEEAKGFLLYELDEKGNQNVTFKENKGAMIYKTVDCQGVDSEKLLKIVDEALKGIPEGSAVRLLGKKGDVVASSLKYFKEKYPEYIWSSKTLTGKKDKVEDLELKRKEHKMIKVTKDNIIPLMQDRIKGRYPDHEEEILSQLEGIVNGDVK